MGGLYAEKGRTIKKVKDGLAADPGLEEAAIDAAFQTLAQKGVIRINDGMAVRDGSGRFL